MNTAFRASVNLIFYWANAAYCYHFNGKESDNDWTGNSGDSYDFGARMYDSRLGKLHTIDPLWRSFAFQSSYMTSANNPIAFIDRDGMNPEEANGENKKATKVDNPPDGRETSCDKVKKVMRKIHDFIFQTTIIQEEQATITSTTTVAPQNTGQSDTYTFNYSSQAGGSITYDMYGNPDAISTLDPLTNQPLPGTPVGNVANVGVIPLPPTPVDAGTNSPNEAPMQVSVNIGQPGSTYELRYTEVQTRVFYVQQTRLFGIIPIGTVTGYYSNE